jgi:membrane-bound metal-dependent hydrolase YbcI (DUF457 family)
MLLAGTLADVDLISVLFGPSAYLVSRHTFTHSIVGTAVVIAVAAGLTFLWSGKNKEALRDILLATFCAALAHVLLDVCTSGGAALLWPWRATQFEADWLPEIDVWILAFLVAGILLPELLRMVSSEIGAKDKAPRGRNGALVALVLLVIYIAARATLHSNAVAMLEPHSYRGESPHKIGAFAESLSVLTWRGVVDTQSNVCLVSVPVMNSARFDPELAVCLHKPEDSSQLEAAQKTPVAQNFLRIARFPRASVDKTETSYEVVIRDMRDAAEEKSRYRVAAQIFLDTGAAVQSQEFVWASEVRLR